MPEDEWVQSYYQFIRVGTREGLQLKQMWRLDYRCWYARNASGGPPTVLEMRRERERWLQLVKAWVEKKGDDLFRCACCKTYKKREEFYRDKTRVNNISSRCKTCDKAYKKAKRAGKEIEIREEDKGIIYLNHYKIRKIELQDMVWDDEECEYIPSADIKRRELKREQKMRDQAGLHANLIFPNRTEIAPPSVS